MQGHAVLHLQFMAQSVLPPQIVIWGKAHDHRQGPKRECSALPPLILHFNHCIFLPRRNVVKSEAATVTGCSAVHAHTPTLAASASSSRWRCSRTVACIRHYLVDEAPQSGGQDSRRRLTSASTSTLVVPPMCHSTISDRSFPDAELASRVWNILPSSVTSCSGVTRGRQFFKGKIGVTPSVAAPG